MKLRLWAFVMSGRWEGPFEFDLNKGDSLKLTDGTGLMKVFLTTTDYAGPPFQTDKVHILPNDSEVWREGLEP